MLKNHLLPSRIIFYDENKSSDFENLKALCDELKITLDFFHTKDINNTKIMENLLNIEQEFIIYSGYGGGILRSDYFKGSKKFIHIHAGLLPEFRGSTTCYYQILQYKSMSASAMFLDEKLDNGDIVGLCTFDMAQIRSFNTRNIDTHIEPLLRARALINALKNIEQKDFIPQKQGQTQYKTYYKIHPVLKHIALLMCF